MRNAGADPFAPSAFEHILKSSGVFDEVNVKKVLVPISQEHPGECCLRATSKEKDLPFCFLFVLELEGNTLGPAFRTSFILSCQMYAEKAKDFGLNSEVGKAALAEMNDPTRDLYVNLYFTWSRKRV